MKKSLIIDGNSILNRAFYGVRPLTNKDGFPTNALYGLINMVQKQVDAINPEYTAVAFDVHAPTFRHKMFDAYKQGRHPTPEELLKQFPVAKQILNAMGFHVLEMEGYEADDLLGTVSLMCEKENVFSYVMTGDKDSLQLISEKTHVLLATNGDTIDMDEKAFEEKYGVKTNQFIDVKALMGDSSDNYPGVPGIGEKTAFKLISDYGSLDEVYNKLENAPHTPGLKKKLEDGKESAYLSQTLATIKRDVPVDFSLQDLMIKEIDKDFLRNQFLYLEFSQFIKKFNLGTVNVAPKTETIQESEQISLFANEQVREEPKKVISTENLYAIDYLNDAWVVSNGISTNTITNILELPKENRTYVVYDLKNLCKQPQGKDLFTLNIFDVMLASYLVNSNKGDYELSTLVQDYLNEIYQKEISTTTYCLRLYPKVSSMLEESNQETLLQNIEQPLALVLADMEMAGFTIDKEGITLFGEKLNEVAKALEAQIFFHAGKEFNINSPKQLGDVLFEDLGLPEGKKTKTGYATGAEILEKIRNYHPIVEEILDYRQVTKLKSTYTDGLLRQADEQGLIHTTFKQTGTATGRLSSAEPNLQNIPIRTELGREMRRFFLPSDETRVIIDADYSQIELRLLADISGDENLISAFLTGKDIHTSTASTVFGVPIENVTLELRKRAKAVNFGIVYGIGAYSLSQDLGVPRIKAQEYISSYLQGYPKVDKYLKDVVMDAHANGYVTTQLGRRRYIPEMKGTNKMLIHFGERVAMNSPIQGTSADIIKIAMVKVHDRLLKENLDAKLILQVHDELLIDASKDCAERAMVVLKEEMEQAYKCKVPLLVDIHTGKNWFEAK